MNERAPGDLSAASSILVVLMGALGDVARGLSLLPPLKAQLPQARITWLVEPAWADLVRAHELVDEVLVFQRNEGLRGVRSILAELRARSFDVSLDLQRHLKSGICSRCSGAPVRIGFHPKNAKEGNWLFNNRYIGEQPETLSKIRHYQLFLEPFGIAPPERIEFGRLRLPSVADELRDAIAIVVGSSWQSKNWFADGYARLLSRLISATDRQILLLGAPGERAEAVRIVESLSVKGRARVRNLVGETKLLELAALLKAAAAGAGPDSGPGHIAAMVGTPYVTLFGPTPPERVAPYGSEHLAVRGRIGCSPCWRRTCPGLDRLCMRLIQAEDVFERLQSVLKARPVPGQP